MNLRRSINNVSLFVLLLLAASCLCAQTDRTSLGAGFDKPLKKTVLDLGPSPFYPPSRNIRKTLTCYNYSTFAVKEYDEGQKGAEWLSIVHSAEAPCTLSHGERESVLTWHGYFWGVKGTYAIFGAADDQDGGMPFAVFDVVTEQKLFEDSSLLDYHQKILSIDTAFRFSSSEAEPRPRMSYFRVVRAGCDLKTERAGCWNKLRSEYGIPQTDVPICRNYEQAEGIWESAVVYPVSVLLTNAPQVKAVDGPVFCWPTN
jgi:hypothetical protein